MTERIEISLSGQFVVVNDEPYGPNEDCPDIILAAIRQQQADIEMLRSAVRMLEHYKADALRVIVERDQLRAKLAAYESKSATITVGAKWPKGI